MGFNPFKPIITDDLEADLFYLQPNKIIGLSINERNIAF